MVVVIVLIFIGLIVVIGIFGKVILDVGIVFLSVVVMINIGVVVIDYFFYGNFFYVLVDVVKMNIKECMKLMLYEFIVGGIMVIVVIIIYGFLK